MSLYSSKIKCDIVDPANESQNVRVEFRLNSGIGYYPTLRLGNFGSVGGDVEQNTAVGSLGLIRHVVLMNGTEEISKTRFANRYQAFKIFNNTNDDNRDINSSLYNCRQGYIFNDNLSVQPGGSPQNQQVVGDAVNVKASKASSVNLMDLLPFLKSVPVLDTSLWTDLRVIVEYETSPSSWLNNNDAASSTISPYLIAEEITDADLIKKLSATFKSSIWNEIEHDQFHIGTQIPQANAVPVVQKIKQVINGFDNKFVSRVVCMKTYSDKAEIKVDKAGAVNSSFGDFVSLAQHKEKINFVLNGKPVLPLDGLDTPAKKAMMLNDTWGTCNQIPYGNVEGVGLDGRDAAVNKIGAPSLQTTRCGEDVGSQDFIGIMLESRINQLEIDFERSVPEEDLADASCKVSKIGTGLDFHIYAEVRKMLTLENGRYIVSYV